MIARNIRSTAAGVLLMCSALHSSVSAKTTQGQYDEDGWLNDGVLQYEENSSGGGLTVTKPYDWTDGTVHDLEIPEAVIVNGVAKPVTRIGDSAFDDALYVGNRITGIVTIPTSVVSIGWSAFRENELTKAILPESLTSLGEQAFDECASLQSVNIPKSLNRLEESTFYGCGSLSSIHFAEGLTYIGYSAFENCSSLGTLELPKTLTRIEGSAFANCDLLKSLAFPVALSQIGGSAFQDCSSLETVVFSKDVSSIGVDAFDRCAKLKAVTFLGDLPSMSNYTAPFSNDPNSSIITIQCYPGKGFESYTGFSDTISFKIVYIAPDIAVFSSSGKQLHTNDKKFFGRVNASKGSSTVTFKIRNTGSLPLKKIGVGKYGKNRSDFSIVSGPVKELAPGATTRFRLKFTPRSKGEREAVLEIQSKDPDEKSLKIKLTGIGS